MVVVAIRESLHKGPKRIVRSANKKLTQQSSVNRSYSQGAKGRRVKFNNRPEVFPADHNKQMASSYQQQRSRQGFIDEKSEKVDESDSQIPSLKESKDKTPGDFTKDVNLILGGHGIQLDMTYQEAIVNKVISPEKQEKPIVDSETYRKPISSDNDNIQDR